MDTSEEEAAAFTAMLLNAIQKNKIKNRQKRRYKVRPINRQRSVHGFYKTYFLEMKKKDAEQFFKYTRMTVSVFENLLNLVTPYISKQNLNNALSPEERLAITLQ